MVLLGTMAVAATGCGDGGPEEVPLSELAQSQESYANEEVTTSGRIARERADRRAYYVLSDAAGNLVVLEPARRAERYADRSVTVSGTFTVDPNEGRLIRIRTITATGSP